LTIVYHKNIEISTKIVKFNHILQKITIFYDLLQFFRIFSVFVASCTTIFMALSINAKKEIYEGFV